MTTLDNLKIDDLKVGDTLTDINTLAGRFTVEREVPPFAVGTVIKGRYASDALFFRSDKGWVNRFGSLIDTDDAWFQENAAEYPVVYTPKEA